MRGNSLSFFKPPVFVKTILLSCAFFASMFFNSCKQLTSFDPNVDGVRVAVSNTFSAPTDLKATHGRKQMISLEWTPVSGAKYYDVYCAESATAEFKKIGGTDKNSFDDKVGAGRTLYYRVCATKSDGTQSELSATVKGTSLAQPVIVGGDVKDYSATISWFMENSRSLNGDDDNYEKLLKFDVCYKLPTDSDWKKETICANSFTNSFLNSYKYELTGLATAENYQFQIYAYTEDGSSEYSNIVNKTTMVSYTPVAPKFKVSEGTSAKEISLEITLPPMVMVNTVTNNSNGIEKDEKFPLYFEIYRKLESENNYPDEPIEKLYCNGNDSAPDYSGNLEDVYKLDEVIKWIDVDSEKLYGGVKYEYRIRSCVDISYGKVVCPEGTELVLPPGLFSESIVGWKSAPPVFEIDRSRFENNGLTLSSDKTKICSVLFGFNVDWNNLDRTGDYKFAIKQNRRILDANDSDSGEDIWLENRFFATLDEINSFEIKFGSEKGLGEDKKGLYTYTLYIVPKDATFVEDGLKSVLDFKETDEVCVTDKVELPKAEFEVQGGYNKKVKITISNYESDVQYLVTRTRLEDETHTNEEKTFALNDISPNKTEGETRVYFDEELTDNCRYSYLFKATASNGVSKDFEPQFAETLGTPDVKFDSSQMKYDSITISFENVLAANKYKIRIGKENDFVGDLNFEFDVDEIRENKNNVKHIDAVDGYNDTTISLDENKFKIVVDRPYGYNDVMLAGRLADLTVTAYSDVDEAEGGFKVKVLGPALINAKGGDGNDKIITMTWDKVDGANGYLIYRMAYKDAEATEIESTDTLYYPATDDDISGSPSLVTGEQVSDESIIITKSSGKYTLQDTDTPAPDNPSEFQKNQSRISWGRPFGYIVLPVKDKADFAFKDGTKVLADGAKVDYTKSGVFVEAQGSTYGYGMNTAASKSDSTANVTVEWKKPNAQTGLIPILYRRVAGTDGSFAKVKKADSLSVTDTPIGDDKYEAFEYVVKYDKTESGDALSVPASLLAELAATTEMRYVYPDGRTEPQNKGYLFALRLSASADEKNTYYEVIDCDWNYSKRGIGPDKLTLSMYNNNIKDDWVGVLVANGEGAFSVIDGVSDIVINSTDRQGVFSVAPAGIAAGTSGTTDGMLKVLRDYKHYYKLRAEHKNKNNVAISYEVGADKSIYAYRQITIDEFIDISALSIGECLYNDDYSTVKSVGTWANDHTFTFKDTSPTFYKVSGILETSGGGTANKPYAYGARRSMGALSSDKSTPCTLTLSSKDIVTGVIYDGKVTIDTMKRDSGKYTVEFNNDIKLLQGSEVSRVSQYFVFN